MKTEKIETIDSRSLMDLELPPIRFVVDRLLPQGLHILAGAAKTGKSWLLLLLSLKVAQGEPFWDLTTEKGTVLSLCLEDSLARIQQRLSELTEEAPSSLHFATLTKTLSDGLLEQLEQFITEHPGTNLVIIDTLQKVRANIMDANPYAADYKDIGLLKALADKHRVAIIVVQHLRKQFDSDPHAMVTGSTGLLGAADGSYVLKRENVGDRDAKLYIKGRDIEEQILNIRRDEESNEWLFLSSDTPMNDSMKSDPVLPLLMGYLRREGGFTGTASELAEQIGGGIKSNMLSRKLNKYHKELAQAGIVFSKSRSGERRELRLVYTSDDASDGMTVADGS